MKSLRLISIACLAGLLAVGTTHAYGHPSPDARGVLSDVEGQGGSTKTALAGTVTDAAGGVIPGATVTVKNNDTGVTSNTVTNAEGAFAVPALDPGTYTVTVSLSGFKTAVINNQRLVAASPTQVKVTLEVGALTETIEVRGGSRADPDADRHGELDADDRAAQDHPAADAQRAVCGEPAPRRRHHRHRPRLEHRRPAGADDQHHARRREREQQPGQGRGRLLRDGPAAARRDRTGDADDGGAGRRERRPGRGPDPVRHPLGHQCYRGTLYDYMRHPSLNTNSWINEKNNLDKNRIILHQAGGSLGGPIYIPECRSTGAARRSSSSTTKSSISRPKPRGRGRSSTRTRRRALYTYMVGGQPRTVNVMDVAARNRQHGDVRSGRFSG